MRCSTQPACVCSGCPCCPNACVLRSRHTRSMQAVDDEHADQTRIRHVGALPLPALGDANSRRVLLPPSLSGGMPLISALSSRQSLREFAPEPLPEQVLSDLLWAAGGINRHDVDGRTAPSAM